MMVLTIGVHGDGPVHKVEIDVGCLQQIQALLKTLLSAGVECAPELAGNEQVLALDDATRNNILESLTDLVLVLVTESAVDVPVAALNGVNDSLLDFTRRRLPRSQAKGGDCGTSVEGDCSVHFGLRVEDKVRSGFEDEFRESGIHGGSEYMYLTWWGVVWGCSASSGVAQPTSPCD